MKTVLFIALLSSSTFAQYQQGKIDMHGGKEDYTYKKNTFTTGKKNMLQGFLQDRNSSKNTPKK